MTETRTYEDRVEFRAPSQTSLPRSCAMRLLEGVTVVPLEREVAAPFATRQLADRGARDERGRRAA